MSSASDKDIDAVIASWLKYSKDREGGLANRGKEPAQGAHSSSEQGAHSPSVRRVLVLPRHRYVRDLPRCSVCVLHRAVR